VCGSGRSTGRGPNVPSPPYGAPIGPPKNGLGGGSETATTAPSVIRPAAAIRCAFSRAFAIASGMARSRAAATAAAIAFEFFATSLRGRAVSRAAQWPLRLLPPRPPPSSSPLVAGPRDAAAQERSSFSH
jgi:hypothetical protein